MMNRNKNRYLALLLTSLLSVSSVQVLAAPMVIIDANEEMLDASLIDDSEAVEQAVSEFKNNRIADPKKAADHLLSNKIEEVIQQVPTDERDLALPEKFDLRDKGVVTPVKDQSPFGTCWGFSAIAACETSILSSLGKTYEETGLDLSEHHLTWFVRTYLEDETSSQNGEGIHMLLEDMHFDGGGMLFEATSVFSSGIGPVDEALVPYRGRNSETDNDGPINVQYSKQDDWTLPYDYAFLQNYSLKESNLLPDTAVYKSGTYDATEEMREKHYEGYDAAAADIWKKELLAGRAVSVAFCADSSMPGVDSDIPFYINTEDNQWTHYTFDGAFPNHGVTIVGWDDTISRTSFLDHTDDEYGDGQAHFPEGDGAWIVKNSWGSEMEAFPNYGEWGIKNEEGKSTGYFYLSYYDRSLCCAESFEFDVTDHQDDEYFEVDQYDFLQTPSTEGWADRNGLQMANVFTAEGDGEIKAVSCQTNIQNTSVTYQIYLMDDADTVPSDGTLARTVSTDYAYAGYHKARLENPIPVKKGQKYAVVVTSCFAGGDDLFYEFSTSTGVNQAYAEEHNRKVYYRNRGYELDEFRAELLNYYCEGIVNEGESLVYLNALGQWGDLAQIIPYLQEDEAYEDSTFDNFPIKAYIDLTDEAQAGFEKELPDLGFAEPAEQVNLHYIARRTGLIAAGFIITVILIVFIVRRIRKITVLKEEHEGQV